MEAAASETGTNHDAPLCNNLPKDFCPERQTFEKSATDIEAVSEMHANWPAFRVYMSDLSFVIISLFYFIGLAWFLSLCAGRPPYHGACREI